MNTMPMIGWSLLAPSQRSHFGFCSSPAGRNSFSMRPSSSPLFSLMRISAFGLPVTSSMFFHRPTGEASSAQAEGSGQHGGKRQQARGRARIIGSPVR